MWGEAPILAPNPMAVTSGTETSESKSDDPHYTKMGAKWQCWEHQLHDLLALFSQGLWEEFRESQLTRFIRKINDFRGYAAERGDQKHVGLCDEHLAGLNAGKAFLRGYREYNRVRAKDNKFADFAAKLIHFTDFLASKNVRPFYTLKLMYLKAQFVTSNDGERSFAALTRLLLDKGWVDNCEQAMKDCSGKSKPQPKVDMSEWFRALFFKALVARAGNMVDNMVARGTE